MTAEEALAHTERVRGNVALSLLTGSGANNEAALAQLVDDLAFMTAIYREHLRNLRAGRVATKEAK